MRRWSEARRLVCDTAPRRSARSSCCAGRTCWPRRASSASRSHRPCCAGSAHHRGTSRPHRSSRSSGSRRPGNRRSRLTCSASWPGWSHELRAARLGGPSPVESVEATSIGGDPNVASRRRRREVDVRRSKSCDLEPIASRASVAGRSRDTHSDRTRRSSWTGWSSRSGGSNWACRALNSCAGRSCWSSGACRSGSASWPG